MSDWLLHSARPNIKATITPAKIKFRDVDCDYGLNRAHSALLIDNNLAITNHIKNLLSTPIGTEDFEPGYGSNLPYRIMDPINIYSAFHIETDIIVALITWMSDRIRVILSDSYVIPLESDDGYLIQITYVNVNDSSAGLFRQEVIR